MTVLKGSQTALRPEQGISCMRKPTLEHSTEEKVTHKHYTNTLTDVTNDIVCGDTGTSC